MDETIKDPRLRTPEAGIFKVLVDEPADRLVDEPVVFAGAPVAAVDVGFHDLTQLLEDAVVELAR